jgi:hypothetical protein
MICLCPKCDKWAHTRQARIDMLAKMAERWGYTYLDAPFAEYMNSEPVLIAA